MKLKRKTSNHARITKEEALLWAQSLNQFARETGIDPAGEMNYQLWNKFVKWYNARR